MRNTSHGIFLNIFHLLVWEKETWICGSTYLFIGCCLYALWQETEPETMVYRDDALTYWVPDQGLSRLFCVRLISPCLNTSNDSTASKFLLQSIRWSIALLSKKFYLLKNLPPCNFKLSYNSWVIVSSSI